MDSPAHRLHARAYPYEHVGRYARPNYYAQLEKMRELPKHGSHSCLVHTAATPGIFVAVVFFSLFELKKKKKKTRKAWFLPLRYTGNSKRAAADKSYDKIEGKSYRIIIWPARPFNRYTSEYIRAGSDINPQISSATNVACISNSNVTYFVSCWPPWTVEEGDISHFFC